jgi:two-component system, chemotaxis family, response regulator PixG
MTTDNQPIPIREFIGSRQAHLFQTLKEPQFTGELWLQEPNGVSWVFYLYLGRLIYVTGGNHPVRRWRRNLVAQVPKLAANLSEKLQKALNVANKERLNTCWEYEILQVWVDQEEISREEIVKIIQVITEEVFFDLNQAMEVTYEFVNSNAFPKQLVLLDPQKIIVQAWQDWQAWQGAKLADRSPNAIPVIKNLDELKSKTSPKTFQALIKLLDGQYTLRDLAIQTKKDVVQLTRSFMPYVQTGLIELQEIGDLAAPFTTNKRKTPFDQESQTGPLIACIDDSPVICQTMESILTQAGYQFIGINNPLRAISTLISKKPQLIFLDLIMPEANGYEICSQLRKLSAFRETPIVILTGNDGIVDRVRAKVVGSSDFISKPVKAETVLEIINKHLQLTEAT